MHTTWANDPVNSPNHYTRSHPGMECIELTADTSFCLGNAIKYLWRYHSKGRPVEDLEKPDGTSATSSNTKGTNNEHTPLLRPIRHSDRHQRTGGVE